MLRGKLCLDNRVTLAWWLGTSLMSFRLITESEKGPPRRNHNKTAIYCLDKNARLYLPSAQTVRISFPGWSFCVFLAAHDRSPKEHDRAPFPSLENPTFLLFACVFGKQISTGFDYNKQDQTRDPRTCCAFCWCAFIEFVGCLTNGTRRCDVFRQVLMH
jgi:hypothetical protein